jgi:hypothetical protein
MICKCFSEKEGLILQALFNVPDWKAYFSKTTASAFEPRFVSMLVMSTTIASGPQM